MDQPTHPTQDLANLGRELFGDDWVGPIARLAGVNARNVERCKQAAREGVEYPAARGVLAALQEAATALARSLLPYKRS